MFKKNKKVPKLYHEMTTVELLKIWIMSKLPRYKESVARDQRILMTNPTLPPPNVSHIAIVLDGVVEDVILCQDRLSALLLSNPIFVMVDQDNKPTVGVTKYINNKFVEKVSDEKK
jgi:hypothetical protein